MYWKKGGFRSLSGRLLAPLLIVVFALVSSVAFAGTLQIKDEEGLLSSADRSALESTVRDYPFDVRVLTTAAHESDFDRYVAAQAARPDMVVVGIDKEHRQTSVHFGNGAQIARSEFHAIRQAGSPGFKNGDFRAGIEAILSRAKDAYGTAPVTDPGAASNERGMQRAPTSSGFPFGWLVLGGLVLVAFLAMRRAFANRAGYQQPPYPQGPGYQQGYGPGGYGPGYGGGGSGLGAGIVGAGLGGLAGYELGKAMGEREHNDQREGGMLGGGSDDGDRSNWDAGGDTGGWDDGGGGGGDFGGGDSGGGDSGGW
jgi:uncharacterized membrane protein YgcG